MKDSEILNYSVQINDGLTQTSADGISLAFDSKYGIMFGAYMPGLQGNYGESRGRISLTYFPASQPTNSRTIDIAVEKDAYCPNILGLGDGKVRVFYEKDSRLDADHVTVYKDFDYITQTLSEEKVVMLKRDDGKKVALCTSEQFAYLNKHGYKNQTYKNSEQISFGSHTIFRGEDGYVYGAITSYLAQPILYRSSDNLESLEFFAICPYSAQYELDYKFVGNKIMAVFRTPTEKGSIYFTKSSDNGKTWSEPYLIKDSIPCRPRLINYNGGALVIANHFNDDTGNRPAIQQARTSVRLYIVKGDELPNEKTLVKELYSKCGIVNVCAVDILGDVYFAYSTSRLALEYLNGNPMVRGKDAIRYVNLGDLTVE